MIVIVIFTRVEEGKNCKIGCGMAGAMSSGEAIIEGMLCQLHNRKSQKDVYHVCLALLCSSVIGTKP